MNRTLLRPLLAAGFTALAALAGAIPPEINISGRLDSSSRDGRAVDGSFTSRIDFFSDDVSTVVIATSTQNLTVSNGVFSTNVTIPDDLLTLDSLYYSVSVDLDANGLDAGDEFADRFEVVSVPYALGARPVPVLNTAAVEQFPTIVAPLVNDIQLVDFVTPPGGARFTHMSLAHVAGGSPGAVTISYAIYDDTGAVLAGPRVVNFTGAHGWTIDDFTLPAEVTLPPNKRCYAAFATSSTDVRVPSSFGTSLPFGRGFVPDGAPGGVLPASFDPGMMTLNVDPTTGVYPSIALFTPPPPMPTPVPAGP